MSSEVRPRRFLPRAPGWLKRALVVAMAVIASPGSAQNIQVPVPVQADLIVKVAAFDRNFKSRAGAKATLLLVAASDDAAAMRPISELKAALTRVPKIADLPHDALVIKSSSVTEIAHLARERRASIVYFGPGFGPQIPAIREAFSNLNVLTVGAVPEYVPAGIVLGFDLVSSRPKLLVHMPQARKQHVEFPASVLNLMKIYP